MYKIIIQGKEYLLPQEIIDDSLTIRDLLNDTDFNEPITFSVDISAPISLEEVTNPELLPVLDFLNCPTLMGNIISKIIEDRQSLTNLMKRICYSIPQLAYLAASKNLMEINELPRYNCSVILSDTDWKNYLNDVDKLIQLLNLRAPPSLLFPEITAETIKHVERTLNCSESLICRYHQLAHILAEIINRLNELDPEVLESLTEVFKCSLILDRMITLKLIQSVRRIHAKNLIPSRYDASKLAAEMEDDQIIDLIMELKLIGNNDNHMINFCKQALTNNYFYPLKYVNHRSWMRFALDQMMPGTPILLSEEYLRSHCSDEFLSQLKVIISISLSGRVELSKRLIDQFWNDEIRGYYPHIPLAFFRSVEECEYLFDHQPSVGFNEVFDSLYHSRDEGLLTYHLEKLNQEDHLQILTLIALISKMIRMIPNISFIQWLIDRVDLESFKEFNISQYQLLESLGDIGDIENIENAESLLTIEGNYRLTILNAIKASKIPSENNLRTHSNNHQEENVKNTQAIDDQMIIINIKDKTKSDLSYEMLKEYRDAICEILGC